jgi:Dit-like phage tail protein
MSISQLIFRKGNFIGEIELDVIVNESVQTNSTITSNPVENGSDVNDHIIINPMTYSISGIVSNTKVGFLGGLNTLESFTSDTTPSQDAWEDLLELQADRIPFTLVTNLKSYDNVVIENLATSQDKDSSNSLNFTANLREIIFVGSQVLSADQFNEQNISDQTTPNIEGGLK